VKDGISAAGGVLMHGPTFMANPLACAVADASLTLLRESNWADRVAGIEQQLSTELESYRQHPLVADVRILGAIGVVECTQEADVAKLQQLFVSRGVWIRPFGKLVYLMPPYIIEAGDLAQLTTAIGEALDEF
jgi:adenosylmethionine-8-amino-7-oxononanoate aminotransferase